MILRIKRLQLTAIVSSIHKAINKVFGQTNFRHNLIKYERKKRQTFAISEENQILLEVVRVYIIEVY